MSLKPASQWMWMCALLLCTVGIGCNKNDSKVSASSDGGKIPITTASDEARKEFQTGRDLSERLLGQESLQHFDKALALDPEFAAAELGRANNSPTAKEFFEHLKKAVALAPKASNGEKLLILANQAGANGVVEIQKEYLDQLVAAYPNDERAQFTLGNYYFGQQDLDEALEHYKKTSELSPNYSQVYNLMGYCLRQKGDYANSEQSFKKYIELIPNDPNPYDSYAELLLKMGRYDESVAQYRKALSIDPHFNASRFGISADLMYGGKPQEAAAELQSMADGARNDGELRTAYFGMAVLASDGGKYDQALAAMDKEYAVAEKKGDQASMAADLQAKGNIMMQMGKYDLAGEDIRSVAQADRRLESVAGDQEQRYVIASFQYDGGGDRKEGHDRGEESCSRVWQRGGSHQESAQLKQSHELAGRIALAEKDYGKAVAELEQANLQNPQNLYRLSQAYRGQGDAVKAAEYLKKTAEFNSLPALPYAFVREKAGKEVGIKG